ncbi:MAG: L-serine ammonia-lyase, iron-sulfur-dependent, subunit alpha [Candidatus Shapirobacteria bacterium]|jgi:L-cysteine desulfidase
MTKPRPLFYDAYLAILREELVPAMGCTEPIAVAFAATTARDILGMRPESAEIRCSANIVKNVKGVTVPNTGGMRGIMAAATAGIVGGNAQAKLEVLKSVTSEDLVEVKRLLAAGFCKATLAEGLEGLYIEAIVRAGVQSAEVIIKDSHTGVSRIRKNGVTVFEAEGKKGGDFAAIAVARPGYDLLNVRDILEFANTVELSEVSHLIDRQISMNEAISDEGLKNDYGVSVGKTIVAREGGNVRSRARARAAAGSDARMGGSALPVVINSGSGNQGLTVSLPVIEYARELKVDHDKLLRALIVSNLVALEQKEYIGKLSAYCGAVSAAVGSGAGITYLCGGGYDKIAMTITNAIATAGGMLCDGAKSSCAAKISTALEAAITAHEMSMQGKCFSSGEGLVGVDVEKTIRNIGNVGKVGMHATDIEIMKIMLEE